MPSDAGWPTTWDLGDIKIDNTTKYKYLGDTITKIRSILKYAKTK